MSFRNHKPYSLRDFLDPVWRYSLDDKYNNNENINFNYLILKAIDRQLNQVQDKTIMSKVELYLKSATHEYLDYFGSWFGLERLNRHESDDHYRKRIINHVKHPRSTIPALKEAISSYLHNHMSDVHIYEPWRDVFLANDYASRTNGRAHFNGYYYRPAIINIYIDTHFDDSVIDMINWFRPVGVIFIMTYENGPHADIWKLHMDPQVIWHDTTINSFIGFDSEECHDLNFLDQVDTYDRDPFYVSGFGTPASILYDPKYRKSGVHYSHYLPLSLLNSKSLLVDPIYFGKPYYSYLATAHNLIDVGKNNTINNLLLHSTVVNPDIYPQLNEFKGLPIYVNNKSNCTNLLSHSIDLRGWKRFHYTYLAGISDKGKSAVSMTQNKSTLEYDFNNLEGQPINADYRARHNLIQSNKNYYVSFDVKTSNEAANIDIQVLFNDQKIDVYTNAVPDKWTHVDKVITVNEFPTKVQFVLKNNNEYSGIVYFAAPYIGPKDVAWEPSLQDLQYPKLSNKYEYIYAYLNVWAFYFKYIEDRNSVYNKLTRNDETAPTSYQLNNYISKQFNRKSFVLTYKPCINSQISTQVQLMDFDQDSWLNYGTHTNISGNHDDTYSFKFKDITPFINNNGLFVIALQVPVFKKSYPVKLQYLGMRFCHFYPNRASIKMYKPNPNIELWWHINTWHIFKWTDGETYDNRSRAQAHYPIRYIRNYVRNVSFGGTNNDVFIDNDSSLNGHRLIADYQKMSSHPDYYIKPYWDYTVVPSLTDNGNPVKSVSILGASCGDNYPTNRLNNLLKNSVFGYFSHPIWGHSKLVYMKKDINSEHVWFNNEGSKLWTETDSIGNRNHYVLTFNARTKKVATDLLVKVELKSNDFTKTLSKLVRVTPTRHVYNIVFNTYGVFPDTVRFVWEYLGNVVERFRNLRHHKTTFSELKKGHYTFKYLLSHIIDGPDKYDLQEDYVPKVLTAFKNRPDLSYMPEEPAYVYSLNRSPYKVPAPKKDNKDISNGWNFNGNLPLDYYPALFKEDGKPTAGYVTKSDVSKINNSDKYLSFIPDGKGDYALGYNFYGKLPHYQYAYLENVHTGKFIQVYGPSKFTFNVTQNEDTGEIMFRDISCHLLARVTVDGKNTAKVPPQVNFKGQDTVGYNDVIFGQAINENDLGETYGDLSRNKNTYQELKDYGITYQELLDYILLNDKEFTWQALENNGITWKTMQNQEWRWLPLMSKSIGNVVIPKDDTTFGDLLHDNPPKTFDDLEQMSTDFSDLNFAHLTFKDLLGHKLNKGEKYYSFNYARNNNWVFADGEPFDTKEHCVTIDLGRVYTNIDHLLVQHGSDSVKNAVYDSCLQTSTDGKHWHTWYDNYKGEKYPLDKPYVEPTAAPVAIPISKYDCFNSKSDFGDDSKIPKLNYVSAHMVHYPVKTLSSLLFNDDRKVLELYSRLYSSTNDYLFQVIPNLEEMKSYGLHSYITSEGRNHMILKPDKVNRANNTDSIEFMEYRDNNNHTSSNYYYPKVPYIINKIFQVPRMNDNNTVRKLFNGVPTTFSMMKNVFGKPKKSNFKNWGQLSNKKHPKPYHYPVLILNNKDTPLNGFDVLKNIWNKSSKNGHFNPHHSSGKNINNHIHDKNIHKLYRHVLFLNDTNTPLNSFSVLQNGWETPQVKHNNPMHHNSSGSIPNPKYSPYIYDTKLFKFNLRGLLYKQFPYLTKNIKAYGIKDVQYFTNNLISNCSTIDVTITATVAKNWSLSIWNYKKQIWNRTKFSKINGPLTLQLSNFENYIDKFGNLYVLLIADDPKNHATHVLHVQTVNCSLDLDLYKVDKFDGGMYPHYNYEYNTNKLYYIKPSAKLQSIRMPWIYKKALGHKVTVSFNLVSNTEGNEFNLHIGKLQSGIVPIEKGYQNFHFIFDIPGHMKGKRRKNLTPRLVVPYNTGNIEVYGFKAEIGVSLSPYTFPRNDRNNNYIINE